MKDTRRRGLGTEGLTLIELIITITILGILVVAAVAAYDAVKAKVRFSQVKADMDGIAQAAYNDYSTHAGGGALDVWAALSFDAMPPNWVANRELLKWPTPPCPGWYYSWENWTDLNYPVVQVTLRRGNNTLLWGYCVDTSGGNSNCQITDPVFSGSGASDLTQVANHYVYCNE